METDSDSEEFFDAQDVTPCSFVSDVSSKTNSNGGTVENIENISNPSIDVVKLFDSSSHGIISKAFEKEIKSEENQKRNEKFKKLRENIETDDDDPSSLLKTASSKIAFSKDISSKSLTFKSLSETTSLRTVSSETISLNDSLASSVDGLHARSIDGSHITSGVKDFRIGAVDDSVSIASGVSLGRLGQILSGCNSSVSDNGELSPSKCLLNNSQAGGTSDDTKSLDAGNADLKPRSSVLQEPDVVASTKQDKNNTFPVPPPRRKKKSRITTNDLSLPATPSLVVRSQKFSNDLTEAINNLAKEIENSLDLDSAVQGDFLVKPQDNDSLKARPSFGSSLFDPLQEIKSDNSSVEGCNSNKGNKEDKNDGLELTDKEILESVILTNLDTGEKLPLSAAEEKLPQCINPLSLHIMRLTSEYVSNSSLEKDKESDEDESNIPKRKSSIGSIASEPGKVKGQTRAKIKRFLGKTVEKTVNKAKYLAHEVKEHSQRHKEETVDSEEVSSTDVGQSIKVKMSSTHKGTCEFDNLQFVQDLSGEHTGSVWTMKFSTCGRLLATAGQDQNLRIWVLKESYIYFLDMRQRFSADIKASPTPSQESVQSQHSGEDHIPSLENEDFRAPFMSRPFCIYTGHTADLLDVSWSKNYFILSSSMDKTVRLWHISRKECLCCFQHIDFVTAIAFYPKDDRYFISGSLDGKIRFWNIPDKKVASWNELDGQTPLITSANFCQDGKIAAVGSYDGRCIFFSKEQLNYYTQIDVRSTRGKNSKGRKISGIEPMPGENKILVTTNDSRIRLYDLRDLSLTCKYKGNVNYSSQIKASFSHDGKYIISGSENQFFYIWKTYHDIPKLSSARRDRNDYWEGIKAHNAPVISAIFSPNPQIIFKQIENERLKVETTGLSTSTDIPCGYVIVTADYNGSIKVFLNKSKPKHSSLPASALA